MARNNRLNARKPGMVSAEDVAKDEGELKVAEAMTKEAEEQQAVAKAELDLAEQILKEHTILAPFDGVVIKRDETPRRECAGQRGGRRARQALKAVRQCLRAARLRLQGERRAGSSRSSPGSISNRGEPLPIEKKKFRGKITFVDPQIQAVAETAVRIRAEFDNPDFELRCRASRSR